MQRQDGEYRVIGLAFTEAQKKYCTIEKELAVNPWAVCFRSFLYFNKFTLWSDHQPLQYSFNMKQIDSRLAQTLQDLQEFDFVVRYISGKKICVADLISRILEQTETTLAKEDSLLSLKTIVQLF